MAEEMKKGHRISLNLNKDIYDLISKLALEDGRTRANYIENILIKEVKKHAAK